MKRLFWLITSLILLGCQSENSIQSRTEPALIVEALIIEDIFVDDDSHKDIKQIVVQFNRPVSIVGALPSKQQLAAVVIDNKSPPDCLWRFIDNQRLACELKQSLNKASIYHIKVANLPGLAQSTSNSLSKTITTPFPVYTVDADYSADELLPNAQLYLPKGIAFEQAVLQQYLKIKTPLGTYLPLTVNREISGNDYSEYYVDAGGIDKNTLVDGEYQVVLQAGMPIAQGDYPLADEQVLHDFGYYQKFTWLGFGCRIPHHHWRDKYKAIEVAADGVLKCDPDKLQLRFSDSLASVEEGNFPGLKGKHRKAWSGNNGRIVYRMPLSGEQSYQLDLHQIRSVSGEKLSNPSVIDFVTDKAKPKWDWHGNDNAIITAQSSYSPKIGSINVESLNASLKFIKTPTQLLQHLNDPQQPVKQLHWPLTNKPSVFGVTPIPLRQFTGQTSGLAQVSFNDKNKQIKKLVNSAGFNISYWHNNQLLVALTDWQHGKAIEDAQVSLLCRDQSAPLPLGRTTTKGSLVVETELSRMVDLDSKNCWLWAQKGELSSAIALETGKYPQRVVGHIWTAQPVYRPGDTVELGFIGRTRSEQGLMAAQNLDDYQIVLTTGLYDRTLVPNAVIELSGSSEYGFASGQWKTTKDTLPDDYFVFLMPKGTRSNSRSWQWIGSVRLEQFIPPEFEVIVDTNKVLAKGESLEVNLEARRLNGLPLKQARASIEYTLNATREAPDHWPEGYRYITRATYSKYRGKKLSENQLHDLDDGGRLRYRSQTINHDMPMGLLDLTSWISSSDGEMQYYSKELLYLGRAHYVGTRKLPEGDKFEVIALNAQGQQLTNLAVSVEFYYKQDKQKHPLGHCNLNTLPGVCELPEYKKGEIVATIQSGEQNYDWQREFWYGPRAELRKAFGLSSKNQVVTAGQSVEVDLYSPQAGQVRLTVLTGNVELSWIQQVSKGNNSLTVPTDIAWAPRFSLHALLILPQKDGHIQYSPDDTLVFQLDSPSAEFDVQLSVNESRVISGETVAVTLKSNTDADAQLWLVNEALWQLNGTAIDDFDMKQKLVKTDIPDNIYWGEENWGDTTFNTLRVYPPPPDPDEFGDMDKQRDYTLNSTGIERIAGDGAPMPGRNANARFAQSVWLDLLQLKANQSQTVKVKLPQLLGRWKLVAVTANHQQFAVDEQTIVTTQATEYFLDAPTTLLIGDSAKLNLMAINSLDQPRQSNVTLRIDGEVWQSVALNLTAGQQKQFPFALPQLSVGEHKIRLTEGDNPDLLAQSVIEVRSNVVEQQLTWLHQPGDSLQLKLPGAFVPASLLLKATAADTLSPNWQGLSDTNQNYPHQCWEQTISRALSYVYNPVAKQLWPEGQQKLDGLLSRATMYQSYNSGFSYFQYSGADPFLSGYSYLVRYWLADKSLSIGVDMSKHSPYLLKLVKNQQQSLLARSMALLALAANGDIDKTETVALRQQIGRGSAFAQTLQIIALKQVKASVELINHATKTLLSGGYQDSGLSILNDNAERCFSVLALGEDHPRAQQLISEVLGSQVDQSHFGSTFADGVCSYVLSNRKDNGAQPRRIQLSAGQEGLSMIEKPDEATWLQLDYQVDHHQMSEQSQGLSIKREYFVFDRSDRAQQETKKGEQPHRWLPVQPDDPLKVGDIVKVELTLNSPVKRKHLAIVDHLPGAFEAISNHFQRSFLDDHDGYASMSWRIEPGRMSLYPHRLSEGESVYRYFATVRSQGRFLAPGVEAQMMYQPSIWARDGFEWVEVKN